MIAVPKFLHTLVTFLACLSHKYSKLIDLKSLHSNTVDCKKFNDYNYLLKLFATNRACTALDEMITVNKQNSRILSQHFPPVFTHQL